MSLHKLCLVLECECSSGLGVIRRRSFGRSISTHHLLLREGVSIVKADAEVVQKLGEVFDPALVIDTVSLVNVGEEECKGEETGREVSLGEPFIHRSELHNEKCKWQSRTRQCRRHT